MASYESIVILGPVVFTDREVPDVMPWGGRHAMSVHKNLGGVRNIDMMGPDPDPIKWSGLFTGKDATKRARLLDALKNAGGELSLQWGSLFFWVVISHFKAAYKHEWEVHYEITVQVSRLPAVPTSDSIQNQINNDWTAALGTTGVPSSIISAITNAQNIVSSIASLQANGDIGNVSLSSLLPAISSVEGAYSQVDSLLTTTEAAILGGSLDTYLGNSALETFTSFATEANNAALASNLRVLRGYLGRIVGNLTTLGG